jgi:hypothetical protein
MLEVRPKRTVKAKWDLKMDPLIDGLLKHKGKFNVFQFQSIVNDFSYNFFLGRSTINLKDASGRIEANCCLKSKLLDRINVFDPNEFFLLIPGKRI